MAEPQHHRSFAADFRRNFLAGLFVLLPIIVTIWLLSYLFNLLSNLGQPLVDSMIRSMSLAPGVKPEKIQSTQRVLEVFKDILSFILVVVLIYLLGWGTNKVLGRKFLGAFDNLVNRIPLAKGIYGTIKQLLSTFQTKPDGVERVVLINFPTDSMKTVGLVMRTFRDVDTGRELAAVYVPTAPNPTSGYLELVPVEDIINTTWTVDEAMRFIVSGGAVGPELINFDKSAERPTMANNMTETKSNPTDKPV
jgi:uncharacterized membrane protein